MDNPDRLLAALDDEQRLVATSLAGPCVVVAGAGTGKTRAITHRIAYASAIGRYDPRAVLAVTFTTRAAGEMRGRLTKLGVPAVQARTFHSAALRQCQYFWPKAYGAPLPRIAENRMSLVADAAARVRLAVDTPLLRDLVGEIGWAKVSNVPMESYAALAQSHGREVSGADAATVARVYSRYEELKRERGLIDFDDILLCNAALLAEHPDVAAAVRAQYRHFVVDEYQDVSPLQEAVLTLWRGESADLCVVGDPAQTIHTFAGADARFLTGFTTRFPGATKIELVRDYRSTPQVVGLANHLMRGARDSVRLVAQRPAGPDPIFAECGNEADEAAAVAAWLAEAAEAGVDYREMAVLFRINAQSPPLEAALAAAGIPYLVRGAERFYERAEVRQALTALRAQAQLVPDDEETPDAVTRVRHVLAGLGWNEEAPAGNGAARERWESLAALVAVAEDVVAERRELGDDWTTLADVVDELDQLAHAQHAPTAQGVTLATLHAAKGLEWDAVALFGIHEGTLPFVLATTPAQLAEERRLLYVGVTRARERLRVSWSRGRSGSNGSRTASRFLDGVRPRIERVEPAPRRRRSTSLSATCRVCEGSLTSAAERKVGRHATCESSYDEALMERLRDWRREQAAAAKLPAYCIFTDATLVAIAEALPTDERSLLRVPGVGATKLAKYGEDVLAILGADGAGD